MHRHSRLDLRHSFNILSLYPFTRCSTAPVIASVVLVNGVLCHGSAMLGSSYMRAFMMWDVAWNVVLTAYVNLYTAWVPWTIFLTMVALVAWQMNRRVFRDSPLLHAVGVQWTLCAALYNFVGVAN